jgi:hypothetical protein
MWGVFSEKFRIIKREKKVFAFKKIFFPEPSQNNVLCFF